MSYNSKTVTLPSGNTVVIKDPRTLLVRERKQVLAFADHESKVAMATGMQDGLIAVMIDSWSFDFIPPIISIESLENLSPADYEMLLELCMPAQEALFPSISKKAADLNDPKATTGNSND